MARRINTLGKVMVKAERKDRLSDKPIGALKLEDLEFSVDENAIRAINEDLDGLHQGIRDENIRSGISSKKLKHVKIDDVTLGTAETAVHHGFGRLPHFYRVIVKSNETWFESRKSDAQNIYLKAGGTVIVDIIIEG